jgi:hypothetical protein
MTELSKREEFARAAMHGILAGNSWTPWNDVAIERIIQASRKIADAQLKELRDNPSEYKEPRFDTGPG